MRRFSIGPVFFPLLFLHLASQSWAQDRLRVNSGQPYLSPEETVRRFTVQGGFEVKLFAGEPDLANPIAMAFDERGRLWVVECFEYPKGTPPGQKPKDRIKIFEDTDGDGRADKVKIFAEGFNLATGIAVGHGGVFLGVAPDLLYLKDTDGDDRADTREVLLTGFGRQDTHELLNTFTWGPDGWLYGCHGVFTHSKVKRADSPNPDDPAIDMNAAVWRYHPRKHAFEIFAEGTSNPWGIDFDSHGNMFLTACVIPHLFHMVPGGRYIRQSGLNRNPYDFGQLKEISDHLHHEESGWAHAGCVVLEGELWPEELRGSVIFGSIHGCSIKRDVLRRNGSSFIASHAPDFLKSGDRNFRPVYQEIGPDGAIYVMDWHDQWPCHQTPPDAWEKERGRVYKIVRKGTKPSPPEDMGKLTDQQLVARLKSPNPYVHRTARRLLDERQARSATLALTEMIFAEQAQEVQVRAVWALYSVGGFDEALAVRLLAHPNPWVRSWAVRLGGESGNVSPALHDRLTNLARTDPSADVRLQLAASCQRLDRATAIPILQALALRDSDARDPSIPLMVWFAYEPHVVSARNHALTWLRENASRHPIIVGELLPRMMRRLAATGKADDLNASLRFAEIMQDLEAKRSALAGLVGAMEGRRMAPPTEWAVVSGELAKLDDVVIRSSLRRLGASFRDPKVIREAEAAALDAQKPTPERIEAVRSIAVGQLPESIKTLETLLGSASPPELRAEVLRAIGWFGSPRVPQLVIDQWKSLPDSLRTEALTLLTGRREWAEALLKAVAAGKLDHSDLSAPAAQRIAAIRDPQLATLLEKTWGTVRAQTPGEVEVLLRRMRWVVTNGKGNAEAGREVFEKKCSICHKFEGKGFDVGPDLTGADRSVEYLLINILDPNRVVGQPYYTHLVAAKNGRILTGKLVSDTPVGITLQGENNKLDIIPRDEIDEHVVRSTSVMPEGLPQDMTEEQFRDLIEFLRRK